MNRFKSTIVFDLNGTLVKMRPAKLLLPKQLISKLSIKYNLAIITGAKRSETLNILKKIGIFELFNTSYIITKDNTPLRKPNPDLFNCIPNTKNTILYIGDTSNDAKMAKEADINFLNIKDFINLSL